MAIFKWILPNIIAGGKHPLRNAQFNLIDQPDFYTKQGINGVISAFDMPLSRDVLRNMPWMYYFQPVDDGRPVPNLDHMCDWIDKNLPVFIHCFAGRGRTAMCIAAYLIHIGKFKTAKEAILWLRNTYNSYALHTPEQYIALLDFNNEHKSSIELHHDLNQLFNEQREYYTETYKFQNLVLLSKRELKLIEEKYGKDSREYENAMSKLINLNSILHML